MTRLSGCRCHTTDSTRTSPRTTPTPFNSHFRSPMCWRILCRKHVWSHHCFPHAMRHRLCSILRRIWHLHCFCLPTRHIPIRSRQADCKFCLSGRSDGSIPVIARFEKVLGIKSILIEFGLGEDTTHSPNENYRPDHFFM